MYHRMIAVCGTCFTTWKSEKEPEDNSLRFYDNDGPHALPFPLNMDDAIDCADDGNLMFDKECPYCRLKSRGLVFFSEKKYEMVSNFTKAIEAINQYLKDTGYGSVEICEFHGVFALRCNKETSRVVFKILKDIKKEYFGTSFNLDMNCIEMAVIRIMYVHRFGDAIFKEFYRNTLKVLEKRRSKNDSKR